MAAIIEGQQILDALADIKEPARLTDIANHVASSSKHPKQNLLRSIKSVLNVGVQYGYVAKQKDYYYLAETNANSSAGNGDYVNDNPVDSDGALSEDDVRGSNESLVSTVRPSRSRSVNTPSAHRKETTGAAKPEDDLKLEDSSDCYGNQRGMRRRSAGEKRNRSRRSRASRSRRSRASPARRSRASPARRRG